MNGTGISKGLYEPWHANRTCSTDNNNHINNNFKKASTSDIEIKLGTQYRIQI